MVKRLTGAQRLVLRFEQTRDEAPMAEVEATAALADQGIDADVEFRRLMALLITERNL